MSPRYGKRNSKRKPRGRKRTLKTKKAPRKAVLPRNKRYKAKLSGKSVPFTLSFKEGHKHHKSQLESTTIVVSKGEFNWCSKVAKLAIDEHALKHGRLDVLAYKVTLHNIMSELIVDKEYTKYIHQKNMSILKFYPGSHASHHAAHPIPMGEIKFMENDMQDLVMAGME